MSESTASSDSAKVSTSTSASTSASKPVAKSANKPINKLFDALKRKSDDELKEQLVSLRRDRFNLRFRQAQGQLEAPHHLRLARREIARIKTLQQQKIRAKNKSEEGSRHA